MFFLFYRFSITLRDGGKIVVRGENTARVAESQCIELYLPRHHDQIAVITAKLQVMAVMRV